MAGTDNCRYAAPEILQARYRVGSSRVTATKESDVYGMGMVIYEASFQDPTESDSSNQSHMSFLGPSREGAILWAQQLHYGAKCMRRGNSPETLRWD